MNKKYFIATFLATIIARTTKLIVLVVAVVGTDRIAILQKSFK